MRKWTKEEDDFLVSNYGKKMFVEIAEHLNRPIGAIDSRRRRLKIEAEGISNRMRRLASIGLHPMQRPEVVEKFLGEKNPSCRQEVKDKISEIRKEEYRNGTAKCGWKGYQHLPTKEEQIMIEFLPEYEFNKVIPNNTGCYRLDLARQDILLCIEIDGLSHRNKQERDRKKDFFLSKKGWTILRFTNTDVLNNLPNVLSVIRQMENLLSKRMIND